MPKTGNRTYKRGGQLNNDNAVTNGTNRKEEHLIHDKRTKIARLVLFMRESLIESLGGDPSTQEKLIIHRAAFKAAVCMQAEAAMIQNNTGNGDSEVAERVKERYLKWSRELRADLLALGLERKAKPVQDLQAYLKQKQLEAQQGAGETEEQ